jgi:hypothetical protein
MIGAILVAFLQVTAPQVAPVSDEPVATAAAADAVPARVIPEGMMDCQYDRAARVRNCTTSEGEVLRCRRERQLGSRFYTWVCFTHREDAEIQRDTQQQMDRQQRISTPGGG